MIANTAAFNAGGRSAHASMISWRSSGYASVTGHDSHCLRESLVCGEFSGLKCTHPCKHWGLWRFTADSNPALSATASRRNSSCVFFYASGGEAGFERSSTTKAWEAEGGMSRSDRSEGPSSEGSERVNPALSATAVYSGHILYTLFRAHGLHFGIINLTGGVLCHGRKPVLWTRG